MLLARLGTLIEALKRFEAVNEPGAPLRVEAAAVPGAVPLESTRFEVEEADTAPRHASPHTKVGLGWLPFLTLTAAVGVAVCTVGDALSRSTRSSSQLPFWAGLAIIVVPIAFRICSIAPRRSERVSLVVLLGLSLYLVKLVLDPFGFTFADELLHMSNANSIARTHELFHANSILPITRYYPGLESVTAALASMTSLSTFGAGLIVIGAARLVIMLALYLVFERVSGSSRIAALGAAIYTANANFLFWSVQFSYESLALPLMVVVLFAVMEWSSTGHRASWATVALLTTLAVVVTHHMSAYALVVGLIALCMAHLVVSDRRILRAPWGFALFALLATVAWLTCVASATIGYLTWIFSGALVSTIHTITGEAAPRQLFGSTAGGPQAPALERIVGIGSV
jgi:hypothetical protein